MNNTTEEIVDIIPEKHLFELNSDIESFYFGCIYSGLAFTVLPIFVSVTYVTLKSPELKSCPVNLFIILTNFANFGQSIIHFLSGFLAIYPNLLDHYPKTVRILAGTINSLWISMFPILIVFAYFRALVTYSRCRRGGIPFHVKIILVLALLPVFAIWILCCIRGSLTFEGIGWMYDMKKPFSPYIAAVEYYFRLPLLVVSNIIYLLIAIKVSLFRRMAGSKVSFCSREWLIVGQVNFCSLYMDVIIICWHNVFWFPDSEYTSFATNVAWILLSHLNLFLLFAFNSSIRRACINCIVIKPAGSQVGHTSASKVIPGTPALIRCARRDAVTE